MNQHVRGCVAEFIGTFLLLFFGAGSILLTADGAGGSLATVALAFGTILAVAVSACMYISGAQFNPAVSIALFSIGKQGPGTTAAYILVQLLAAACGVGMLAAVFERPALEDVLYGAAWGSLLDTDTPNIVGAFALEAIMTLTLMFVILGAVVDERAHRLGGLWVGVAVAACIFAFGPHTGASMNPARSFGPALYAGFELHWLFWAAPVTGAVIAAWIYKLVWETDPARIEPPAVPLHEGDPTTQTQHG